LYFQLHAAYDKGTKFVFPWLYAALDFFRGIKDKNSDLLLFDALLLIPRPRSPPPLRITVEAYILKQNQNLPINPGTAIEVCVTPSIQNLKLAINASLLFVYTGQSYVGFK
jgi:hypothetical protein